MTNANTQTFEFEITYQLFCQINKLLGWGQQFLWDVTLGHWVFRSRRFETTWWFHLEWWKFYSKRTITYFYWTSWCLKTSRWNVSGTVNNCQPDSRWQLHVSLLAILSYPGETEENHDIPRSWNVAVTFFMFPPGVKGYRCNKLIDIVFIRKMEIIPAWKIVDRFTHLS
jgi:hypothetical protein